MRDSIARMFTWICQLLVPQGRHAARSATMAQQRRPSVVPEATPLPHCRPDVAGDEVFWLDEPLVRAFVIAQEEERKAEQLLQAHRNAALLAAEEGRDYPDELYLSPDTTITPARAWTAMERA